MITLETLVDDLRRVPPEHLEEIHRLILQLKTAGNKHLAAETMRILTGTETLPAHVWAEIDEQQQRVRAELFTRPKPAFDNEANPA